MQVGIMVEGQEGLSWEAWQRMQRPGVLAETG